MPKIACFYLNLIGVALTGLSLSVTAQETGNARGLIGESPYDVVSGWLKPFQELSLIHI